jgi:hypothetical protein
MAQGRFELPTLGWAYESPNQPRRSMLFSNYQFFLPQIYPNYQTYVGLAE